MSEEIKRLIDTVFPIVITSGMGFLVHFLSRLSGGISDLNLKIGIVIERISDHDNRIRRLEKNVDKE